MALLFSIGFRRRESKADRRHELKGPNEVLLEAKV